MPGTAAHRFVAFTLLALVISPSLTLAKGPGCLLVKQFVSIDSIMTGSLQRIDPVRDDSVGLLPVFREILQQHTGFYAFIVADDRGRNKQTISFEELGNGFSGDLSRAEWYRNPRKFHTSYFGGLLRVNGRFCLIWSKPCMQRNALGFKTCRGVVTALVNVGECLKLFSEEFRQPFELAQGRTVFFHSDDWREGVPYREEPVQLADNLILTLRFPDEPVTEDAGADAVAAPSMETGDCSSLPARSNQAARLKRENEQVTVSPTALLLLFCFLLAVVAFAMAFKRLPGLVRFVRKRFQTLHSWPRKAEVNEDRGMAKQKIMNDLYAEMKSRIEKYEITKIENDVRERLKHDVREKCRCEITKETREMIRGSIIEEERMILREEIRDELRTSEMTALRNEARADLRQRLQKEIEEQETALLRRELLKKNVVKSSSPVEALAIFDEHQTGPHLTVSTTSGENGVSCQAIKSGDTGIFPVPRTDNDQ
jgi:hypothetical protein